MPDIMLFIVIIAILSLGSGSVIVKIMQQQWMHRLPLLRLQLPLLYRNYNHITSSFFIGHLSSASSLLYPSRSVSILSSSLSTSTFFGGDSNFANGIAFGLSWTLFFTYRVFLTSSSSVSSSLNTATT